MFSFVQFIDVDTESIKNTMLTVEEGSKEEAKEIRSILEDMMHSISIAYDINDSMIINYLVLEAFYDICDSIGIDVLYYYTDAHPDITNWFTKEFSRYMV